MPVNYSSYRAVDPAYTGFLATTKPTQNYIGRALTPRISVNSPDYAGKVWVDTHVGAMGTPQSLVVTPGAPLPRMTTQDPSTVSYSCDIYGLASSGLPKVRAARSQVPVDLVQREQAILMDALLIAEEVRYAALYGTSGNWTTTVACGSMTGGTQWSSATATPLTDLHDYLVTYLAAAHGNAATDIIIPYPVAAAMGKTSELRGALPLVVSTQSLAVQAGRPMNVQAVAAVIAQEFGLRVHIGSARYNTANLGQSHTETWVWGEAVWLGTLMGNAMQDGANVRTVATAALGIDEISALADAGLAELGSPMSAGVDELSPSAGNAWIPYVQHAADEIVVSANLGATITNCLA